jgi:hypothetical protein
MKNQIQHIFVLVACCCQTLALLAQTPSDDLLMKKREFCVAATYETGSWKEYWEGTRLRTNANIGTFSRDIFMPMLVYGITDKINVMASLPYISTGATGGQLAGAQGLQDLALAAKAELVNTQVGSGKVSFLATLGYSFPVSNYLSDYLPFSIGLKTRELSTRGILQYRFDNGIYLRGAAAYLWRGQTRIERNYYYNNGSYYSEWMDVPSALNYHGALGVWLLKGALRLEANYMALQSTSGDDIRIYNSPQPTNKMSFEQIGFFGQYYFKGIKALEGVGVLAYYSDFFSGRNMGKFQNIGGGITYQFGSTAKIATQP